MREAAAYRARLEMCDLGRTAPAFGAAVSVRLAPSVLVGRPKYRLVRSGRLVPTASHAVACVVRASAHA